VTYYCHIGTMRH